MKDVYRSKLGRFIRRGPSKKDAAILELFKKLQL